MEMVYVLLLTSCLAIYVSWSLYLEQRKFAVQQSFSRKLLENTESERRRIARRLHDRVGQEVVLLKQKIGHEVSPENAGLLDGLIKDIRTISREIYSPSLANLGFVNAVRQLIDWYDRGTDIFLTAEVAEVDLLLDELTAGHLFSIIQEGLQNIVEHAEATAASLKIEVVEGDLYLYLRDYGKGFKLQHAPRSAGIGLLMMKNHAAIINADIEWTFPVDGGTIVMLKMPIA